MTETMTDNKPYLLRAMYEWICDNELTPYIYVETSISGILLPDSLLAESPQVLNISSTACQQLSLANDAVSFQTRFAGKVFDVLLPVNSILAIVARENGQGMTFEVSETIDSEPEQQAPAEQPKKPTLKIVK